MNTNSIFWERVQVALDRRRDPLEDEGVRDAIAVEPELLDELLVLRSRLDALPHRRERSRLLLVAAAASVAIAAGAIAFYFPRAPSIAVGPVAELATPTSFAQSEIIDFELSITTERPGLRDTVVVDRTGTRRTREIGRDAFEFFTLTTEVLTPRGR